MKVTSHSFRYASVIQTILLTSSIGGADSDWSPLPIPHPITMLVRAEVVHRELGLSVEQATAVVAMAAEAELPLWRLRDAPAMERDRTAGPILSSLRTKLDKTLSPRQIRRLDELVLQAQGLRAVLETRTSETLKLTQEQIRRIRTILRSTGSGTNPAEAQRNIRAVLGNSQLRAFESLLGRAFDLSRIPQVACRAPEIEGVAEWINSPPVSLAQWRGKVVVVHFYAFGCINCVRNLPHYNGWFDQFRRDQVAILGIHRPETEVERDIEQVRRRSMEAGIKYPVAVDNEGRNWDAWVNRVWPSVYLIDKRGFVRYWWYGELNWQGAQGELWMRSKIAELSTE